MTKTERERARKHLYKQKGSQNWFLRMYLNGRQVRETTGTKDETEACRIALVRLDEAGADRAQIKKFVGPEQSKIKVQELLDALQRDYVIRKKKTGPRLLSNLKPLSEWFGHYKAVELTSEDVDRFIEHAQQFGRRKGAKKPSKQASIARCLQLLHQSFKLAIRAKRLTYAPYIRSLGKEDNVRQGFFDAPDFYRVLSRLPDYLKDFTLFAYLCGWRCGEIKSLKWADVDGDSIILQAAHSKNRTGRSLSIAGELAQLIERRKAARSVKTDTGTVLAAFIFHNGRGEPVGDFRKAWATACLKAGVPGRLFHDLRRSAVRDMVRSGTPQTVAMSISGHKTASVFQRYSITDQRDQTKALIDRQEYAAKQEQAAQQQAAEAQQRAIEEAAAAQQRIAEEKPVTELVQ
jgi:integrase